MARFDDVPDDHLLHDDIEWIAWGNGLRAWAEWQAAGHDLNGQFIG